MIRNLLILFVFLSCSEPSKARVYEVGSAAELNDLDLEPGDVVVMRNGEWKDQELVFEGTGTKDKPIVLKAQDAGQAILTGSSKLKIDGQWLIVDGLKFEGGAVTEGDVIAFSKSSSDCRLTHTAIIDYNPVDDQKDYKWVSLYGERNRVDHCYFAGKNHQGTTLVVWLSERPNYHRIDHNYFGHRPPLGRNGGETIRIGTSTWSLYDSYTQVDHNIFDECDGETEIISNKSCNNTFFGNVFFRSNGTLTLRHGNDASVYGNYFIGKGKSGSGGVRIIGENHKVYNNYFHGLSGKELRAAVSMMNGLPDSPLTGYYQVKNARVVANTIANCEEAFAVGSGNDQNRVLPALNSVVANNVVCGEKPAVKFYDPSVELTFTGNIAFGENAANLPEGFTVADPGLKEDNSGIFRPTQNSVVTGAFQGDFPFVDADIDGLPRDKERDAGADEVSNGTRPLLNGEAIGPGWMDLMQSFFAELRKQ